MAREIGQREWTAATKAIEGQTAKASTLAMADAGQGAATDWKRQVESGFKKPQRLINTIKVNVYPKGQDSLDPTAWVYSKARDIMAAYASGTVIRAKTGRFLAIPTDDVPRTRNGGPLTPVQVEAQFGKPLIYIAPHARGLSSPTTLRGHGAGYLAIKDLVSKKASGRYRNATANELARGRAARPISLVIMFILVTQTQARKRFDLPSIANKWEEGFSGLFDQRFEEVSR